MSQRRGAALPTVLLAVALISALSVGGIHVARQLIGAARTDRRADVLRGAAERSLTAAVAAWDTLSRAAQPVGVVIGSPPWREDGVAVATWVCRLDARTYWLIAEASSVSRPFLRRRLGLVIHMNGGVAVPVPARAWAPLP
jgi:hypothetical protein